MMVKLKHPKHGIHFVHSEYDLAQCKAQGWTEVVETVKKPVAEPQPVSKPEPKPVPKKAVTKKAAKKKAKR